jgi:hypothetical protein
VPNLSRDLFLLFGLALVPLLLLAVSALFDRLHRARVERLMKRSAATRDPVAIQEPPHAQGPLVLQYLDVSKVGPVHGVASRALIGAADTTRRFRNALSAAALVYMAVLAGAVVSAMMPLPSAGNGIAIAVYCLQGPPLCLFLWNVVDSVRVRLLVLAAYVGVGAALVLLASAPATAAFLLRVFADTFFVMPMAGLIFLLARRLRPVLVGLSALVLFVAISMGIAASVYPLLGVDLDELPSVSRWIWVVGIASQLFAIVVTGWLLRRSSVRWPIAGLVGMALTGIVVGRMAPTSRVDLLLVALPSYVLQMYVLWLLFKTIVRLQDSRYLPAQVLQFHLCWGFLTVYYEVLFYYGTAFFARSASGLPSLAFVLYVVVLHLLLRRQWNAVRERPARRLLFLRTFGGAERSERMLDSLDDTWRRLGRIDLIAGTDLAMRTLGSRMLEAILLRRADAEFLKTPDDVHRRLGHLRSDMEGDARFPINEIYCYASAWQSAVVKLAPESDVVLMDLSSFTPQNTGCVFELTQLARLVPLERLVLIADGRTDRVALEEVLQGAWARLPSGSPNAHQSGAALTVLVCAGRAVDDARALVAVVLRAGMRQEATRRSTPRTETPTCRPVG